MNNKTRTAKTIEELQQYLNKVIETSCFELTEVNISQQDQWHVRDGALTHSSGGFFHVNGVINQETKEEHLILFQPQSALTGLALCRTNGTVYILLQARIEPGNTGIGQIWTDNTIHARELPPAPWRQTN